MDKWELKNLLVLCSSHKVDSVPDRLFCHVCRPFSGQQSLMWLIPIVFFCFDKSKILSWKGFIDFFFFGSFPVMYVSDVTNRFWSLLLFLIGPHCYRGLPVSFHLINLLHRLNSLATHVVFTVCLWLWTSVSLITVICAEFISFQKRGITCYITSAWKF